MQKKEPIGVKQCGDCIVCFMNPFYINELSTQRYCDTSQKSTIL